MANDLSAFLERNISFLADFICSLIPNLEAGSPRHIIFMQSNFLSMNENMEIINYDSYLGFKHKRPMELSEWFSCVELLKEQPSDYEHGQFQNKWEEIKAITSMNVALNAGI